jgi:ribosomal protein S14
LAIAALVAKLERAYKRLRRNDSAGGVTSTIIKAAALKETQPFERGSNPCNECSNKDSRYQALHALMMVRAMLGVLGTQQREAYY